MTSQVEQNTRKKRNLVETSSQHKMPQDLQEGAEDGGGGREDDDWFFKSISRYVLDSQKSGPAHPIPLTNVQNIDQAQKNSVVRKEKQHRPLFGRYTHLCQYRLSSDARLLDVSGDKMAIVSENGDVVVFRLPQKLLTSCPKEQGLSQGRDVAMLAGKAVKDKEDIEADSVASVQITDDGDDVEVLAAIGDAVEVWKRLKDTGKFVLVHLLGMEVQKA